MLMGEKIKRKDLDAIYREFEKRRIFVVKKVPLLMDGREYRLVGLTNEYAENVQAGDGSMVDLYRQHGVNVQFPKAPCMILQCEEDGQIVLALIDQCIHCKPAAA